jgi:uncharacterized protein YcfJ
MLTVAIGSLLVGGLATAAYVNNRASSPAPLSATDPMVEIPRRAQPEDVVRDAPRDDRIAIDDIATESRLDYAEVVAVQPVTRRETLYATVIGTEPVRETVVANTPRELCEDVVVQERLPERDGHVGGAVAGAVIGGLVGNQIGDGNGRKLATVAGAVGGGFAGREIDRRHVGGRVVDRVERQCRSVSSTSTSSRTVAWNVTYREPDGRTGTLRTDSKPGKRIALGSEDAVIGYDVTYRYAGQQGQLRLNENPGPRLPVVDGRIVTQTASVGGQRS